MAGALAMLLGAAPVASGPVVNLSGVDGSLVDLDEASFGGDGAAHAQITFDEDGGWTGYEAGAPVSSGLWISPNSADIGAGYYIRFTPTSGSFSSGSTSWQQLNTARAVSVSQNGQGTKAVTYTVEIATDSGGSNIVASAEGLMLVAQVETGA